VEKEVMDREERIQSRKAARSKRAVDPTLKRKVRKPFPLEQTGGDRKDPVYAQWKRFIEGLPPEGLRSVILESWKRSLAYGITPERFLLQRVDATDLKRRLRVNQELIDIASLQLDWIASSLSGVPHAAYLVDRDGIVLSAAGNDAEMRETFGLLPGYDWSERTMGTNGAGTALAANQPVAVVGPEHFSRPFHDCTCTGAPIHADGKVIGAIDISTSVADGNPERLIWVTHIAYVIEQALMHRRAERLAEEIKTEAMTLLAHSLDYETVLSSIARLAVSRLADWCAVDMAEGGFIVRRALAHADPGKGALARALRRYPVRADAAYGTAHVIRTGRSELHREVSDLVLHSAAVDRSHLELILQMGLQSIMVVPLPGRGKILGAMVLGSAESGRRYSRVDLALAEELARRAALAIESAQLYHAAQKEIEHRKRAEEESKESQRVLSTLMSNLPGMAYRCRHDENWTLEFVSEGALELTGYPPGDFIGDRKISFPQLIHSDDLARVAAEVERAVQQKEPFQMEYRILDAEGREKWVWEQGCGIYAADGHLVRLEGFITDITDRKRMEEALRQKTIEVEEASWAKSQFVSIISHELRTPLNAIIGYSDLLRRPRLSEDESRRGEMIDRIYYNAQILLRLINNLLDLNRMEAGQMPVEAETVYLHDVIGGIVDNLKPMGEEKGLTVSLIDACGPLPIRSDSKKVEQIVTNLISNAIKFTEQGSVTVRLSDFPAEQRVAIEVSDTGIGIGEEDLPHLFEPFYQADTSNTRSYEGSGLGLSIVKKFTELIGGTIQVASAPGVGTTFTVTLPYEMSS
jgi:PAS domain S-box-containing protein